jgi:uncharacterized delta-60 repeat protein
MNKKFSCKYLVVLSLLSVCCCSTSVFAAIPGTLDTTFNSGGPLPGTQLTDVDTSAPGIAEGYGVALQSDGKIVAVGYIDNTASLRTFGVARFNTNGLLDTTFNPGGALPGTVSIGINAPTNSCFASAVAIQSDGKIVVAGSLGTPIVGSFAVARFNTNGTLDTTFNPSGGIPGTASTGFLPAVIGAYSQSLVIQSDNKIVLNGFVVPSSGSISQFALARFNGDVSITDICTT